MPNAGGNHQGSVAKQKNIKISLDDSEYNQMSCLLFLVMKFMCLVEFYMH